MRRKKVRRRLDQNSYLTLETRNLLAANLFVDFGFGFENGLNITSEQSRLLGGPEVFGERYELGNMESGLEGQGDFNGDGTVDRLDAELLASSIIDRLNEIFLPFDVSVVQVDAENLLDVQQSMVNSSTNDAYVYVGASTPDIRMSRDHGVSLIDDGNTRDNIAFVASESVFEINYNTEPDQQHLIFQNVLSRAIAKQAGHTFGLESTDSHDRLAGNDVMSEQGTFFDIPDFVFTADYRNFESAAFFTNIDMEQKYVLDISPGMQNSYAALGEAVGFKFFPDRPAYFSGTGVNDLVEIMAVDDTTVNVMHNGLFYENVDVTNGIYIATGFNNLDSYTDRVTIDASIMAPVYLLSAGEVEIVGGPAQFDVESFFQGNVNENVTFVSRVLIGSEFDDVFDIDGAVNEVRGQSGNDRILFGTEGSADDVFGGDGNDRIVAFSFDDMRRDGGEGYDIIDFSNALGTVSVNFNSLGDGIIGSASYFQPPGPFTVPFDSYVGFERMIASKRAGGEASFNSADSRFRFNFLNQQTNVVAIGSGERVVLENFDNFKGQDTTTLVGVVREMADSEDARPELELTGFASLKFFSQERTLEPIEGYFVVHSEFDPESRAQRTRVIVDDSGGSEGQQFLVRGEGVAVSDSLIFVETGKANFDLRGTQFEDEFEVSNLERVRVKISGGDGDDNIELNDRLNHILTPVAIDAGNGNDRVFADSFFSRSGDSFRFENNELTSPNGPFQRLTMTNAEDFELRGSNIRGSYFAIAPSATMAVTIVGSEGNPEVIDDRLRFLIEPESITEGADETSGTATFGDSLLPIEFFDIDNILPTL